MKHHCYHKNVFSCVLIKCRCQLDQQKEQLALYYADRDKAIEKLDKTGADMQQTKQHSMKLEAKVFATVCVVLLTIEFC